MFIYNPLVLVYLINASKALVTSRISSNQCNVLWKVMIDQPAKIGRLAEPKSNNEGMV